MYDRWVLPVRTYDDIGQTIKYFMISCTTESILDKISTITLLKYKVLCFTCSLIILYMYKKHPDDCHTHSNAIPIPIIPFELISFPYPCHFFLLVGSSVGTKLNTIAFPCQKPSVVKSSLERSKYLLVPQSVIYCW